VNFPFTKTYLPTYYAEDNIRYKSVRFYKVYKDNYLSGQYFRHRSKQFFTYQDCKVKIHSSQNYTHSETWLELNTEDVDNATDYLKSKGVETCDELEQIPKNMHWITDPAGTVFIVKKRDES